MTLTEVEPLLSVPCPTCVVPSMMFTVPPGTIMPGAGVLTVTPTENAVPDVAEPGIEVIAAAGLPLVTVSASVGDAEALALKLLSPE